MYNWPRLLLRWSFNGELKVLETTLSCPLGLVQADKSGKSDSVKVLLMLPLSPPLTHGGWRMPGLPRCVACLECQMLALLGLVRLSRERYQSCRLGSPGFWDGTHVQVCKLSTQVPTSCIPLHIGGRSWEDSDFSRGLCKTKHCLITRCQHYLYNFRWYKIYSIAKFFYIRWAYVDSCISASCSYLPLYLHVSGCCNLLYIINMGTSAAADLLCTYL